MKSGSLHEQIEADMQFHTFINELSGNPLIGETTAPHWPYLRRVMGEVLRDDAQMPQTDLQEHVAILDADHRGQRCRSGNAEPRSYFARGEYFRAAPSGSAGRIGRRTSSAPDSAHSAVKIGSIDAGSASDRR